jgi:hypothetical protein
MPSPVLGPEARAAADQPGGVLAPCTPRVRRKGLTTFVGRVHEMPVLVDPSRPVTTANVNPSHCRVEQLRSSGRAESMARNLRISEAWVAAEPDDARGLATHAFNMFTFHALRGEPEGMVKAGELAATGEQMEPRYHTVYMLPSLVAAMQGRYAEAARLARAALDPEVALMGPLHNREGLAAFAAECEQKTQQPSRLWVPPSARGAVAA